MLLNCSETDWKVEAAGEILYQRKYEGSVLAPNGVLVARMMEE